MATAPAPARSATRQVQDAEQELLDVEAEVELIQRAQERQLSRFKGLNASLVKKLRKAEAEAATLLTENKVLEQKNADLVEELRRAQLNAVELAQKEQELVDTQTNLRAAQKDLIESQLLAKKIREELDTVESERAVLGKQHGDLKETSAVAHRGLADKQVEYDALHKDKSSLATKLAFLTEEHSMLTKESMERSTRISSLEAEKDAISSDLAENKSKQAAIATELAALKAEKVALDKSLAERNELHTTTKDSLHQVTMEKAALESRNLDLTSQMEMVKADGTAKEEALAKAKMDMEALKHAHQQELKDQLGMRDADWSSRHRALRNDIDSVLLKHASPESTPVFELPAPPSYSSLIGSTATHSASVIPSTTGSPGATSNTRELDPSQIGSTRNRAHVVPGGQVLAPSTFDRQSASDGKRNSVVEETVVEEMVVDPRDGDDVLEEVDDEVQLSEEEATKKRQGLLDHSSPAAGKTSPVPRSPVMHDPDRLIDDAKSPPGVLGDVITHQSDERAEGLPRNIIAGKESPPAFKKTGMMTSGPTMADTPVAAVTVKGVEGAETGVTPVPKSSANAATSSARAPTPSTKKAPGSAMMRVRDMFKSCCASSAPPAGT
jgi:hypothetical protein